MLSLPPLHYYPVITTSLFIFTFVFTYALAVGYGHTEGSWPYISDTSASPPESCIFAQLVNVGAVLVGIVVYIRYKQVHEFYASHQISRRSCQVNSFGLYVGWAGAIGLSVVANFQEFTVVKIHLAGAIMAFGVGNVYMWTQVYASYKLCSLTHGEVLKNLRLFLATVNSIGFVLMLIAGEMALYYFKGKDPEKWHPEDGGWELHVVSSISEWVVALNFNVFLCSFYKEFKQVTLDSPRICLRINRMDSLFPDQNVFQDSLTESVTSVAEDAMMIAPQQRGQRGQQQQQQTTIRT